MSEAFARHVWLTEEMLFKWSAKRKHYERKAGQGDTLRVVFVARDLLDARCSMASFQRAIYNLVNIRAPKKQSPLDTCQG